MPARGIPENPTFVTASEEKVWRRACEAGLSRYVTGSPLCCCPTPTRNRANCFVPMELMIDSIPLWPAEPPCWRICSRPHGRSSSS